MLKRYEYWGSENGKAVKKFTDWFEWDGEQYPIQLNGFKGNHLHNEYTD